MKLQFDAKQEFQIAAVNSVVDLFEGQPLNKGDFQISFESKGQGLFGSLVQTELGLGNALVIDRETILKNLQLVQERNDLDADKHLLPQDYTANAPAALNFSVEMETGTGKTYVYLRSVFELNKKYGFKKFIIVVPSVAIREGVLKNLQITSEHFKALYNNVEFEYFVYDAKKANRLRQFAVSNQIQILVINIDAFRKNFAGTEDEKKSNVTVKHETDLFLASKERGNYRDGFLITEINAEPGNEFIQFNNGKTLNVGQEFGGIRDDLWRVQIRNTIRRHLDKEIALKNKGIKVLSLFFIDRVANYRSYDEQGQPVKGKFAECFEEAFKELIAQDKYKGLLPFPLEKLHNGYFAQDKKGVFKDTNGSTQADDDVYSLIMQRKEDLLSLDEPLRFIFSHSALREGWDNPNVFQICTLNETRSVMKKRQEIGRGLRLPVNQHGERVFDENINKLLVVANDSYEDFAKALQNEYEQDCGVTFGKVPKFAFANLMQIVAGEGVPLGRDVSVKIFDGLVAKGIVSENGKIKPTFDPKTPGLDLGLPPEHANLRSDIIDVLQSYQLERHIKKDEEGQRLRFKKEVTLDPEFQELWNRISPKTSFSVEYQTDTLVINAVKAIKAMDKIKPVKIQVTEAGLGVGKSGVSTDVLREAAETVVFRGAVPDVVAYLQGETELTRSTLVRILKESNRLAEFLVNPQKFMDAVAAILKVQLHKLMIDGIKYEKIAGEEYSMTLFEEKEIIGYLNNRLEVNNSVYDAVVYDSEIEREFAEKLDKRQDIKLFVKLPDWFKIETPLGTYNPDWAILKHDNTVLYLVRETKGTKNFEKLRNIEAEKIRCGRRHFETLEVDFDVVTSASEI